MLELAALGVTGIFTDDPRRALRAWVLGRQVDQPRTLVRDVSDDAAADRERLGAGGRHVGDQLAGRPDHLQPRDRAEEGVVITSPATTFSARTSPLVEAVSSSASGLIRTSTRSPFA